MFMGPKVKVTEGICQKRIVWIDLDVSLVVLQLWAKWDRNARDQGHDQMVNEGTLPVGFVKLSKFVFLQCTVPLFDNLLV